MVCSAASVIFGGLFRCFLPQCKYRLVIRSSLRSQHYSNCLQGGKYNSISPLLNSPTPWELVQMPEITKQWPLSRILGSNSRRHVILTEMTSKKPDQSPETTKWPPVQFTMKQSKFHIKNFSGFQVQVYYKANSFFKNVNKNLEILYTQKKPQNCSHDICTVLDL